MILDYAAMLIMAEQCAPNVAPRTLAAIAHAESRFDTLAIGVNKGGAPAPRARSAEEAARIARTRIDAGDNLDLGIAQINHRNLGWLGLTVEQAFDACRNLAAAGHLLTTDYRRAVQGGHRGQAALRVALSRYNTGDPSRGFANGYVGRVEASAQYLRSDPTAGPASRSTGVEALKLGETSQARPHVFARQEPAPRLVFHAATHGARP